MALSWGAGAGRPGEQPALPAQVLDDKNVRRRFRASNYQSTTRVKPFICTMPMRLDDGWNQIQFNLSDFTRRAYGTNYIETLRVQVRGSQALPRETSSWWCSCCLGQQGGNPAWFLCLPCSLQSKGSTEASLYLTRLGGRSPFPSCFSGWLLVRVRLQFPVACHDGDLLGISCVLFYCPDRPDSNWLNGSLEGKDPRCTDHSYTCSSLFPSGSGVTLPSLRLW